MSFINKIISFAGKFDYRRRAVKLKRVKKTVNLNDANKIGLLYRVSDQRTYNQIVGFIKNLQSQNKKIDALGFVMSKDVPSFFSSSNSYSFFTLKDLNWYKKPSGTFVSNFLSQNFDIVINLSLEDYFPLQYIAGLSFAKMKVGKFGKENASYYDLMIETDNIKDISDLSEQIVHYLSIIKNKDYVQ